MSNIPTDLRYSKSHEWLRLEDDGVVTIGITDVAQALLGDLVFVELPEVGEELGLGHEIGVVESVKAASDVYIPVSGEIISINNVLTTKPELINLDPYGDGWICRVQLSDESELDDLLDSDEYAEIVAAEGH